MTNAVQSSPATWEEIGTNLVEELKVEFPNRFFGYKITNQNKNTIYEHFPNSKKKEVNLLVYSPEKKTISNFKSFANKKDQFICRVVANRVALKNGLVRNGGWLGNFLFFTSLLSFGEEGGDPNTVLAEHALSFYRFVESIPNLHFSLSHSGNEYWCTLDGYSFKMNVFFSPKEMLVLINQNTPYSDSIRTPLPFENSPDFTNDLIEKIKSIQFSQLFKKQQPTFFEKALGDLLSNQPGFSSSSFSAVYNGIQQVLGITANELEILYLETANRNKVTTTLNIGDYRFSVRLPSHQVDHFIVFNSDSGTARLVEDYYSFTPKTTEYVYFIWKPFSY